jgi:tetratricopeptide (TPR) repeat protein
MKVSDAIEMDDEFQNLLQEAYDALDLGDWAGAQALFQKALESDPQHLQSRLGLSKALFEQGDLSGARTLLTSLIKEIPDDSNLVQNYSLTLKAQEQDIATGMEHLLNEAPGSTAVLLALEQLALSDEDTKKANQWLKQLVQPETASGQGRLNRARGYWYVDNVESARQELDQMVAEDPENPQVYYDRGEFFVELGDIPGAIADFEQVSQLDPETSLGYQRSAEVYFDQGEYRQALELYQKALERDPQNLNFLAAQGFCYENLEEYDQALGIYDHLVDLAPEALDGYYYRGRVYVAQQKADKAEADYKKVIKLAPEALAGYQELGTLYLNANRLDEAVKTFRKAVRLDPQDADAHNGLGITYRLMNEFKKALFQFRKVIELLPDNPTGYRNSGEIFVNQSKYHKALKMYQKAFDLDSGNRDYLVDVGLCYENLEQYHQALEIYNKLVQWTPQAPDGYYYRGRVYALQQKVDQAEAEYQKVIELAPNALQGYQELGMLYLNTNRLSKAVRTFRKAIKLDSQNADAHNGLGLTYEAQAKQEKALLEYRKVVELLPDNPVGYRNCGNALVALMRYSDALEAYNKMIELAPDWPDWYQLRAQVYQAMAQNAALEDAQAASESKEQPSRSAELFALAEKDFIYRTTLTGQNTDAYLDLAGFYFETNRLDKALETVNKIQEWEKESSQIHLAQAQIYENMSENMDALKHYSRAIRLDNENAYAYAGRGRIYINNEEYGKALSDLNRALELVPDDPQTITYRGIIWETVKDYSQALKDYQAVVRLLPGDPQAHMNVANILMTLEGYDLAADEYELVLTYGGDDVYTLTTLADIHRMWATQVHAPEHYNLSIQAADRALIHDDQDPVAHAIKGCSLALSGRLEEGLASLDRALVLKADYFWGLNQKSYFLYCKGDYEAALEAYRKLKESSLDHYINSCAGEVVVLRKLGRTKEADELLANMLGEQPQAQDYQSRCFAFYDLDEFQMALADCKSAIQLDSEFVDAYNMAAWILADGLCDDLENATSLAERGVELAQAEVERIKALDTANPQNVGMLAQNLISLGLVLDTLGWVWYRRGDLTKAEEYLARGVLCQEQDQLKRYHLDVVRKLLEEQAQQKVEKLIA